MQKIKYLDFPEEVKIHKKEYLSAIERVLDSGSYVLSHEVENFEKEMAKYLGVKHCIGTANGLEAIQIVLMGYGIGKGDEVITTPISAVATTLAILAVGATPIFADVNKMGQINADLIEGLITNKTKAILPVDLYGQPCDLVKIRKICDEHKLIFIEDACQAHGSTLGGNKLGTFGNAGCLSFYPTKNLGAFGDGGAIVTNDDELVKIFRELRDYGQQTKYVHARYGLNSRLDELHAAILSVKLKYLDEGNNRRREIAKRYIDKLKGVNEIEMVLPENISDSNFHLFVIKTDKRNELQNYLKDQGVPSLVHYPITVPDQPMFGEKYKNLKIDEARKLVGKVLSLPCNSYLKTSDIDYISVNIIEFFRN